MADESKKNKKIKRKRLQESPTAGGRKTFPKRLERNI